MHRRPLGGGRTLAAVGGLVILVGCVLPWWQLEQPGGGLPPSPGAASRASGILCLLAGIGAPCCWSRCPMRWATARTPIDRWEAFALLAVVGWIGLAWRVIELLGVGAFGSPTPPRSSRTGRASG